VPDGIPTIAFGLAAAAAWGAGDFGGGLASRRSPVFGVVLLSQLVGMALTLVIAVTRGEPFPAGQDLVYCVIAGALGGVGITALYRGLAVGRMGIVAPVTGVLAAVIPVTAGFLLQGLPSWIVVAGIVVAIVAVILVSRVADDAGAYSGLREALLAGLAIGLFGVVIAQIGDGFVFSSLTVIRGIQAVFVTLVVLVTRSSWRLGRDVIPLVVAVGLLDMTGNACYLLGVQAGQLAVASVLSSLYPVTTIILAATFLHERVTREHLVGIVLAVVAIALIGFGSAV
jgi:drug/metabolite transporter (DMT)-like permease